MFKALVLFVISVGLKDCYEEILGLVPVF